MYRHSALLGGVGFALIALACGKGTSGEADELGPSTTIPTDSSPTGSASNLPPTPEGSSVIPSGSVSSTVSGSAAATVQPAVTSPTDPSSPQATSSPDSGGGSGGMSGGAGGGTGAGGIPNDNAAGGMTNPAPGAGGEPAQGSGGSPSEPTMLVNLPRFVTSAANDYWNTDGQVVEGVSGSATLTVDPSVTHQRWDGFGGTFNEMGWDALSVVSAEIPRAMTLLFDAQDGANFVYGRLPIGASDYSMSWYTLAETENDYTMEHFSIARDEEMLIPYVRAALQIKPELRLWGSPWVVPSWMMSGRNMKNDAQTLEAHALYFAKFVQEYAKQGLTIEAVHQQNEPGYARVTWTHPQFIDFIKTYLGPKFEELGLGAEIWCGTMSHPDDADIATTLTSDPDALRYTKGFGLQWNLQDTVAELAPFGPVMQTEHKCGNYNFATPYWDQSRYDASKPQNDHLYGEESWQLIRDWIVAGVNSYSAWNMVLDSNGRSLDGWPQNALLVVDRDAEQLILTPAYYAFRHYSQYIAPGATRVEVSGNSDAVAFANPSGSIVLEVYNSGEAPEQITADVAGQLYQFGVPAHGWATLLIDP